MLYYEELPPLGRRFYHRETGGWGPGLSAVLDAVGSP